MFKRIPYGRSLGLGLTLIAFLALALAPRTQPAEPASPAEDGMTYSGTIRSPDTVLVKVNGEAITQGDVDTWVNEMIMTQLRQFGAQASEVPAEHLAQFRQMLSGQAREHLINRMLFDKAVQTQAEKVTDAQIEEQLAEMKQVLTEMGVELEELLSDQNINEQEMREQTRQQIAVVALVEASEGTVKPTEAEVREYFEQHKDELARPEQVRTSHILLGYEGDARDPEFKPTEEEKAKLKAKAEEVRKEVLGGGDFAELARKHSTDPSVASNAGDMGYIGQDAPFVDEYKEAAFKLKEGEVSQPVETQFGFHIIKLVDRREAMPATFEAVGKLAEVHLRSQNLEQKIPEALKKLREKAQVEVVVPPDEPAAPMMPGMEAPQE